MPVYIPWLEKKKDKKKEKSLNQKEQNTKEENELLEHAQERFTVAKSNKTDYKGKPLHEKWRRMDKIYRGSQWFDPVPDGKSTPVMNYTFALVEALIPRMTDHNPDIAVYPRTDPEGTKLADMLTNIQSYLWYANRMSQKLPEAARMAIKYGTSIFKVIWNPDALNGLGDVEYTTIHPMNFFPDPRAYTVEDMSYCFVSVPKTLEYYHANWPDKAVYIDGDEDWVDTEHVGTMDGASPEQTAALKEYWFFDKEDNLCVMYYCQDLVLEVKGGVYSNPDNPEPLYVHNTAPFAKFVDYPVDKEFWGIGEIEIVEMLQMLINSFEAQIIDNTRLMANGQWLVNKVLSGMNEEDAWVLDNYPGGAIFTHNGGVDKIQGTPIPPHIPQHIGELVNAMEQILGIHDVVQGRQPGGVRAASAIIALQESANIRVKQKSNNMGHALEDLCRLANWLVLENYDEPRKIRIAGTYKPTTLNVRESLDRRMVDRALEAGLEDELATMPQPGMTAGDVRLSPQQPQIDPMTGMPVAGMPEMPMGMEMERGTPEETGVPGLVPGAEPEDIGEEGMEMIYEYIAYPEFDIEVHVGPSVPYSQALRYEEAKELYQLGVIDRRAVLDATSFPGKEEIIERMEQQEAQVAMQESPERMGETTFRGGGGL